MFKKLQTKKVEIISVTPEQRQRFLMNVAKLGVSIDGTGFEARLDLVSMLMAVRGIGWIFPIAYRREIKEECGEDIFKILNKLKVAVADMVAYKSDIETKVMKKEDVTSVRFLKYRQGLARCYQHLFFLDKLWVYLAEGTELETMTVPSHYWSYVSRDEVLMPEEPEFEKDDGSD